MKTLRNPWWWIALVLFVGHQLLNRGLGVELAVVDDYLDPFCAAPILLGLWRVERQLVYRVARLGWVETAVATLVLAVLFEEVFPRYEEGFQRDAIDYVFYALGGVYFYFLIDRRE
jgi:hypothetical protein